MKTAVKVVVIHRDEGVAAEEVREIIRKKLKSIDPYIKIVHIATLQEEFEYKLYPQLVVCMSSVHDQAESILLAWNTLSKNPIYAICMGTKSDRDTGVEFLEAIEQWSPKKFFITQLSSTKKVA